MSDSVQAESKDNQSTTGAANAEKTSGDESSSSKLNINSSNVNNIESTANGAGGSAPST